MVIPDTVFTTLVTVIPQRNWWVNQDLNLKLNDYESCALPIKLLTLMWTRISESNTLTTTPLFNVIALEERCGKMREY